jgi:L-lactate dehydrogenase complex protein LldG
MLGRMPAPAGDTPPETALPESPATAEQCLARLLEELEALGVRTLVAAGVEQARAYIERVVAEKVGEVVRARRPAVKALGLAGPRFHWQGDFPARDAAVSVSQADYALAETGTLAFFSEAGEGRTLSLLAPVNITVLPASRIVWGVAALLAREPEPTKRSSALLFVTGPSRTADIELILTIGVHGPGEVHAIILADA